ncbi:MAG: hypothetical protein ACR2JK_16225 [Geodermatophilaceae bacterium]
MRNGHGRVTAPALIAVLALLGACAPGPSEQTAPRDPYEAFRGILLDDLELEHRSVVVDEIPELAETGPAYQVVPPSVADLRALAEAHAGGPVQPGLPPRATTGDLTGFDAGDGWFTFYTDFFGQAGAVGESWSWVQEAWSASQIPQREAPVEGPCPAGTPLHEEAVRAFFKRLGIDVEIASGGYCIGKDIHVQLGLSVDGHPLLGPYAGATVNGAGEVVSASASLLHLKAIGDVPLAPVDEVLRRLVHGPGLVSGTCHDSCSITTAGASLGLALVRNGGIGSGHDHTPGGIVDRPLLQTLLPALRLPATSVTSPEGRGALFSGVLAVSSAVLVDDPEDGDAARLADETSVVYQSDAQSCIGNSLYEVGLCVSNPAPVAGNPVLLTIDSERYEPVGASGCDPLVTLDPGDGTPATSFVPRAGTLLTGRVAHRYPEPGTYTVKVHAASRCEHPAPGGGTEPEYDYAEQLRIMVTP